MPNGLATADYIILVGFFVVMLAIGFYFARRMHDLRDFFSGGRVVPWWISGVSLFMTTFSAYAFVGYSATAYKDGFVAIFLWWIVAGTFIVSAWFLASRWRRAATTSPVEFIERRYGPFLRQGFAWIGVPLIVIDDALKLYVIGTMVAGSLGFDNPAALPIAVAVCGVIILAYTFLGGLWAVLITDFVQFVVLAAAVFVLAPLVIAEVGGFTAFFTEMPENTWTFTTPTWSPGMLIAFTVVLLLANCAKWPVVQRYYAVRTDREARRVGYLVAGLLLVGMPVVLLPALGARIFLPGVDDANLVYSLVCRSLLPVGMLGMIIAAMFSATMSMLSSDYNAVASVITNDIYRRLTRRTPSDRALVFAGRVTTFGVGLTALAIALVLAVQPGEPDLVKVMAKLFGVLLPPTAIPMIFGLLTRHTSNTGAVAAFLTGALCGVVAYFLSFAEPWAFLGTLTWLTAITSVPTLVVLLLISALLPDAAEKRVHVDHFLDGLAGPEEVLPTDAEPGSEHIATAMALRVIGMAGIGMGALLMLAVLVPLFTRGEGGASLVTGLAMTVLGGGALLLARRVQRRATA